MVHAGTDIIEIDRIKNSLKNPRFLSRLFSAQELKLFISKGLAPATIAANFAAKEAFSKAIGTGFRGFSLSEVSVLRDSVGAPYISLSGNAKKIFMAEKLKMTVSLSHCRTYATAVVIVYRD